MNVGQLIQRLSAYPPDMPVVVEMEDEPSGDYEVAQVSQMRMVHDRTLDGCGLRTYTTPDPYNGARCDAPCDVVLLGHYGPVPRDIDAAPIRGAIDTGGSNP